MKSIRKMSKTNWEVLDTPESMAMAASKYNLIGVIDCGTNTVGFSVYQTPKFTELCSHKMEIIQITPQDGWCEQNPLEIMTNIRICAEEACKKLEKLGYKLSEIATIGITNQRETTIVWDKLTGEPLYNAILWSDIRTDITVDRILAKLPDQNKNHFKDISGLPISPYSSALKLRWLKDNIPAVRKACRDRRCYAGTVDTWIIWNLTGGVDGGLHITDVTNASRTLLMNIDTLHWDPVLTRAFSIHPNMLPQIRSSSEIYGKVKDGSVLNGIYISGILGNQQASLLGQMCFKPGQAKNTYRSGCFLLCNTGEQPVLSSHGLVTTVAYKLGKDSPTIYALEGAVAVGGSALKWLKNSLGLLKSEDEVEDLSNAVHSTGDVYFVPAFTGLYAPYWRKDARGTICGLTQFTNKNHLIRATLEAICFQTRDIIECMNQDCGFTLNKLHADGILSANKLLMQLQADITGIPVLRSQMEDTTALGIAMCAAHAEGINSCELLPEKRYYENARYDTYLPTSTHSEREIRYTKWKKAVQRSLGWAITTKSAAMTDERYRMLASIPASIFLISSFTLLIFGQKLLQSN